MPYSAPDTDSVDGQIVNALALRSTKVAMAASDIDLALGNFFTKTATGTITLTVSNVPAAGTFVEGFLELTNGGAHTINLPAGSDTGGGDALTLTAAGRDLLGFYTHDGGATWNWVVIELDLQ